MSKLSSNSEPLFDRYLSKNSPEVPTMYDAISLQLSSPRTKRLNHESTVRNWRSSLACFASALKKYSAEDLRIDGMFEDFLDDIERSLRETVLAASTLNNYTQVLHAKLLVFAEVDERIRKEVKQGIRNIRKKQKQTIQKAMAIDDAMIVGWLKNLDRYCKYPKSAPNLFKLARKTSKMAYKNCMSQHHLLLLRGYVWLTLASGARTGEIRSLCKGNISTKEMTRTIYKMKVSGTEVKSNLPPFVQERICPMVASIKQHAPNAKLLFCEHENKKGEGTIDPKLLQELVKGSMIASGMPPTSPGGYYRLHDLRKVWARWIDENGGSLESISAFLTHSSTQVTYKAYFADDHKQRLAQEGQRTGLNHLKSLLSSPMNDMAECLSKLREILSTGGSIYAEHSFGLRHTIKPTESAGRTWSPLPDLNRGHPDVC